MTRIFYLESFLIKPERHFIEVTLAMFNSAQKQNEYDFIIVGNKQLNEEVKELLPGVVPAISQTIFEDLEDKGESLYGDLLELDKQYGFTSEDLLILPTCYENQVLAIKEFAKFKGEAMPKAALQFHVLFPPAKDSDDVLKQDFQDYWCGRLEDAFKDLPPTVSLWTTESETLNSDYERLAHTKVGKLSVPFLIMAQDNAEKSSSKTVKVGFLGEGRQEKGLLLLLRTIEEINKEENPFSFFIQNNNPRGFSDEEMKELLALLDKVKGYENVKVVDGGIRPVDYHRVLTSLDCMVLPYNPGNYVRRVSGLLIQASMYNIPSIVSSGTDEEASIKNGETKGMVFPYDVQSKDDTVENLIAALREFLAVKDAMSQEVLPGIEELIRHNSAATYMRQITAPHPELKAIGEAFKV